MKELGVVRYDAMCRAIVVCVNVDEVKDIRDKARALEVYAAQALNTEAEYKAAEIRLRAERRAGELLKEMKRNGQRENGHAPLKKVESNSSTPPSQLKDLGISRTQSSDWQKLAEIPEEEFEEELSKPGVKPTTEGLLAKRSIPSETPRMDPDALQAWGRLKDFERDIMRRSLPELFESMTQPMKEDVIRIAPSVIDWLEVFLEQQRSSHRRRKA